MIAIVTCIVEIYLRRLLGVRKEWMPETTPEQRRNPLYKTSPLMRRRAIFCTLSVVFGIEPPVRQLTLSVICVREACNFFLMERFLCWIARRTSGEFAILLILRPPLRLQEQKVLPQNAIRAEQSSVCGTQG